MCLERLRGGGRGLGAIQLVDQPARRHERAAPQQQDREQGALTGAAELDSAPVVLDFERA